MNTDRYETQLRYVLGDVAPATGLAERLARAVRMEAKRRLAPTFDIAASERGLVRVRLGRGRTSAPTARARANAAAARAQLAQYLRGARAFFDLPLDLGEVPPFQREVLGAARAIPFGTVRPYAWIATRIDHARAVRAVGTALGTNPLPLVIPCHRVVRTDGGLGGYIFGTALKRRLLALEHETPVLVGCTTTRILCVRGCPHERRIGPDRRVVFASVADARSVGYRPCAVCGVRTVDASATTKPIASRPASIGARSRPLK